MGVVKSSWYDDQPIKCGSRIIKRKDISRYATRDLRDSIDIWREWKRFGLSGGGGPDGETAGLIDLLTEMENEYESAQADARSR